MVQEVPMAGMVTTQDDDTSVIFHLDERTSVNTGPRIYASIAGGATCRFMVDTGSSGIVVTSRHVGPHAEWTGQRFTLVYTSSGRMYEGEYVWAHVDLYASHTKRGTHARTVRMLVRAVERAKVGKNAPWLGPDEITTCMMGVGFDRDTGPGRVDPGGHPIPADINPFLRLEAMVRGIMLPGFIVNLRERRITLGLTPANTAGFEFVHLEKQDPPPPHAREAEWAAPTVWLAVLDGGVAPLETELLVDTGLGYAIVQAPLGIAPPQEAALYLAGRDAASARVQLAAGLHVALTSKGHSRPFYEFEVGKAEEAPEYVSWRHRVELHDGRPFINTSRHALSQFEYLYDDCNGRIGFRFFKRRTA